MMGPGANNLKALSMSTTEAPDNTDTRLVPLDHHGLLAVEGPDANRFLQGQITCDLRDLGQSSRLGAQCNLKGRMLASFRVLQDREQRLILRLPKDLLDSTRAALGKYIVFSKAQLNDITPDYRRIGLAGPQAGPLLTDCLGDVPGQDGDWLRQGDHLLIRLAPDRFECWLAEASAEPVLDRLQQHCQQAHPELWTLLDIRAGWGEVRAESQELFTPQALNFELVNGVSFRKGCYTGQEVVARMHYKGQAKKRMHRVGFSWPNQDPLPAPGAPLPVEAGLNGTSQVVMAARCGDRRAEALTVLSERDLEACQSATEGQKLQLLPLPYAIPMDKPKSSL